MPAARSRESGLGATGRWHLRLQNEEEDQGAGKEVQACEKERCTRGGIGYEAGAFVVHSLGAPPGPREEEVKRLGVKG